MQTEPNGGTIYTIGHSTRPLEDFLGLLNAHSVHRLVDIRTVPRSRHNPQFNRETLPESLRTIGVEYTHLAQLGGLRRPRPDSPNRGWKNESFRGYADYMLTDEFEAALLDLIRMGQAEQVAVMCAEAVPWRCHRSLVADALTLRGVPVEHILSLKQRSPHRLTPWAEVAGTRILYPEHAEPDKFVQDRFDFS
jgi:uncharacterized protein (DUF488 family)